ncbi:MAG: substrate-binding domain-containing protein [Desulfocapsa sp.]|nr:substrate-binding domain-containing protein [Desulfocapsa sp.]
MYKKLLPFLFLLAFLPSALCAGESIRCASTTSTRNSGLLEYLLPIFKADSGVDVEILAVSAGAALELGQKGDVDCVLVHDQDLEKQLVDEGYFVDREDVMYNDFVLLGPAGDPAGVTKTRQSAEAFKKIREAGANFVSRGDNSGTNMRENRIWASTGIMPCRNDKWYLSSGQGMAETIRIASARQAYTITDRATWLSMQDKVKPDLSIVLEGDSTLFNQYGVMIVNPAKYDHVDYRLALNFVIWLTSPAGQQAIGAFKDDRGNALFTPNAK